MSLTTRLKNLGNVEEGLKSLEDLSGAIGEMDDLAKSFDFAKDVVKFAGKIAPFLGAAGALFSLIDLLKPGSDTTESELIIKEFDKIHDRFDTLEESKTFDDIQS